MSTTPQRERHRLRNVLAVVAVSSAILLTGCARTPVGPTQGDFGPVGSGAEVSPSPTAAVPSLTTITPTPTVPSTPPPTTKPKPVDPFDTLSEKTKKEFKGCLTTVVGPGSAGHCAQLVVKKLKAAGYYPWAMTSTITMVADNALLNYQRSRGITGTGKTNKATWVALATKAPAIPQVLPDKCKTKGIWICVDQAHRKLFWVKNGTVVKTVKVRVGGYNYLKKKGQKTGRWKIYATANGTWKVYDKQVNPKSDNYGSGAMPYSTMFYPDMYVHYSPGFHAVGYAGSSHGCVNVGSLSDAIWIYRHTPIGATVYVYSPKK